MSGLLYLTHEDFYIAEGQKGPIMCHKIPNMSLILFYSTACQYCQHIIPIFKTLPGKINGCQFGLVNISNSKQCIAMSKQGNPPIQYVPFIVLYIDGKPFMIYREDYDINKIAKFVMDVASKIQQRQRFTAGQHTANPTNSGNMGNNMRKQNKKKEIPAFATGIPVFGDKKDMVCYLDNCKAYAK